jgi:hypothetical protein
MDFNNAQSLKTLLVNLSGSSGGHRESADRYRALLDQILASTDAARSEFLKIFIEARKCIK